MVSVRLSNRIRAWVRHRVRVPVRVSDFVYAV